jgi:hypothetical protein
MIQSETDIRAHAATLAEEIAAGVRGGRAIEWLGEVLTAALLDVARAERERCAALAMRRADMWEGTVDRYASEMWPAEVRIEARERRKEALVIADAISCHPEGA